MDAMAALLDGPRARGAFLLRSSFDPPWSLRIQDEAPLTVLAVVRGSACLIRGGAVHALSHGDVAVVTGPAAYVVADGAGTAPQVVIHPGQRCTKADGQPLSDIGDLGVRAWGNSAEGATELLTGTYAHPRETSRRLLAALPSELVLHAGDWDNPLVGYLADEVTRSDPGQEAVLDRLLDLLLIAVVREWFARNPAPGWWTAHGDAVVGPALRLMLAEPATPWTIAALARAAGTSRSVLARRFRALVGESPMAFLTSWRLSLAADLLREPDATVAAVARDVGYGSAFALSAAFRREHGVSPSEHRRRDIPA